jgi:hypothetical protein
MSCSMKLKENCDSVNWDFVKTFNSTEEVQAVRSLCENNFWREDSARLIVVRTDNLRDLAKDLFIPTVIQSAVKVNSFSLGKIFIRLGELILDFFTLPLRVLTLIPRAIYNTIYPKEKDPFYLYCQSVGALYTRAINSDSVHVMFEWVEEGEQVRQKDTIAFKALPRLQEYRQHYYSRTSLRTSL